MVTTPAVEQKELIRYRVEEGVAILEMDDPPANNYTYEMMNDHVNTFIHAPLQDGRVELAHHPVGVGFGRRVTHRQNGLSLFHPVADELFLLHCWRGYHCFPPSLFDPNLKLRFENRDSTLPHSPGGVLNSVAVDRYRPRARCHEAIRHPVK